MKLEKVWNESRAASGEDMTDENEDGADGMDFLEATGGYGWGTESGDL